MNSNTSHPNVHDERQKNSARRGVIGLGGAAHPLVCLVECLVGQSTGRRSPNLNVNYFHNCLLPERGRLRNLGFGRAK